MIFPWGKHRGIPVKDVPKDYLDWAIHNADKMSPELRAECERVLGLPAGSTTPLPEPPLPEPPENEKLRSENETLWKRAGVLEKQNQDLARRVTDLLNQISILSRRSSTDDKPTDLGRFRRIIKQWFGAMSRRYHPDMGGSVAAQTVLNTCYHDLIERLDNAK